MTKFFAPFFFLSIWVFSVIIPDNCRSDAIEKGGKVLVASYFPQSMYVLNTRNAYSGKTTQTRLLEFPTQVDINKMIELATQKILQIPNASFSSAKVAFSDFCELSFLEESATDIDCTAPAIPQQDILKFAEKIGAKTTIVVIPIETTLSVSRTGTGMIASKKNARFKVQSTTGRDTILAARNTIDGIALQQYEHSKTKSGKFEQTSRFLTGAGVEIFESGSTKRKSTGAGSSYRKVWSSLKKMDFNEVSYEDLREDSYELSRSIWEAIYVALQEAEINVPESSFYEKSIISFFDN